MYHQVANDPIQLAPASNDWKASKYVLPPVDILGVTFSVHVTLLFVVKSIPTAVDGIFIRTLKYKQPILPVCVRLEASIV